MLTHLVLQITLNLSLRFLADNLNNDELQTETSF